MRRLVLLALLAGCGAQFAPSSDVSNRVRILAVKAEPPELDPAGAAAPDHALLSSLVADVPELSDGARSVWVFHLACTPDPAHPQSSPCTSYASLVEPSAILAASGKNGCPLSGSAPGCVSFVGAEHCTQGDGCAPATIAGLPSEPVYVLPAGFTWPGAFAEVVVVSLVVASDQDLSAADPAALQAALAKAFKDDPTQENHVLAVKRIEVRGAKAPADAPNVNPQVRGILADGAPLGDLAADATVKLLPDSCGPGTPGCERQVYSRIDADGVPTETLTEEWLYSFYVTTGKLDTNRTLGETKTDTWSGPATHEGQLQPIAPPAHERDAIYVVVRDRRGGIGWAVVRLQVR